MRWDKVKKLLSNKYFYVLLGLAVAVIAVNGFMNRMNEYNTQMEQYSVKPEIEVKENNNMKEEHNSQRIEEKTKEIIQNKKVNQTKPIEKEEPVIETSIAKVQIELPLQGQLLEEHSNGELVYNKTMEDWRTHNGIDIAADVGTAVKAAADGIVTKVGFDGLYGFCVTIDHKSFITKYCGMQKSDIVSMEQKVKTGDIIGGVGVTADIELSETPHLHFELIKDGKSVNPLEYASSEMY